jgi:glycosyltransferase involved in cell wall biosynthesis
VLFNSRYHLEDWFDELPRMLKHFPDYTHVHRIAEVQAKAEVLPVGCDLRRCDRSPTLRGFRPLSATEQGVGTEDTLGLEKPAEPSRGLPPLVLWNQRWEYDKDPDTMFRALHALADEGLSFRVALAGKSYRESAPEFESARERLGPRVVHFGHADEAQYAALLRQADVVVSTALHEFFGVAVVEAIYCGCFPVLPRRLSYPELVPPPYHEACLYEDREGLLARLRWALAHPDRARALAAQLRPAVARFDWAQMGPCYDEAMDRIARAQE